ncbi:ATP-dependent DNA helicase PcrA [bacterium BMS3Abin03]|nr:ATP-dependent DNA helicase PcrA [bacterium BMS3Abin03]
MKDIIELSEKQEEAVSYKNGALLVHASAGSGKTRVLTERIKRLLDISKKKVLAITFTNKAGDEMRVRLGDSEKIKSQVFIGTFHGFCQQVIEMRGNLIGLSKMPQIFEQESDRLLLIEQAIQSTPSYLLKYKNFDEKKQRDFRYRTLEFISKVKRELLTEEELLNKTNNNEDAVLLFHSYQEILASQNAIDFDDLIMLTHRLFINNPSVAALYRRTYEYICIDEAQDLNNAQYQLLKSITNGEYENVMMVGDPNQSIFAFNGSSSDYMNKKFIEDFNPKIIELKENYRSAKKVIEAAEKIIPDSNEIINAVIPGIFEVVSCENESTEAEWILDKINELILLKEHDDIEGQITYEKIAILARNKYVFAKLEEELIDASIPFYYKITPGAIKFESITMNIFDLALRVKLNPSDNLHLSRLLRLLGVSGVTSLQDIGNFIDVDHYKKALELVIGLKDDGSNLKKSLKNFSVFIKETNSIKEDDDRKMILDEINEILKHWTQYARKTDKESLNQFKNAMALGQTHPLATPKGITLSTVHTMKGQEYEIVFLMGMDDGTFPDYRAVRNGGIEMKQEKNNTYVAFTRARRFLYVTFPEQRLMPWGAVKHRTMSRFLKKLS